MKTIKDLFDYLSESINANCYITIQHAKHKLFNICIDTQLVFNRFEIEYLKDHKDREFYLYDCWYYKEEELVWKILESVSIVIEMK